MQVYRHLIVCEHCDHVYRRVPLARGGVMRCSVCGAVLERARKLGIDAHLALAVAGAVIFVLANVYPVMQIGLRGLHNEATLWQAVMALMHGAAAPIAVPAAAAAVIVPGLQLALLLWVLGHARLGLRAPGLAGALRLLAHLRPWSMVEVALFAALVAIVKLSGFLNVAPEPGIWAVALLTLLLPLLTGSDIRHLWALLDAPPGAGGEVAEDNLPVESRA